MAEHDLIPPWTQLPNILMDYVIPLLRESEEKVLLYVLRRTYGFKDCEGRRKERDVISFSQFLGGRVSSEGKPLDFGCGISRSKLVEALAFLQEIDLVQRVDKHAGKAYAGRGATGQYHLNLQSGMVQKVNQYLQDPVTSREKMVQYLNQCRLIVHKMNQLRNEARKLKRLEKNGSESEPLKNGSESEPLPEKNGSESEPTKERKIEAKEKTPPEKANAFSSPHTGDEEAEGKPPWGREWPKAKRFPKDFPHTPPQWFLDYCREQSPHVDVTHEWEYMLDHTFKSMRTQFFMVARRWMETAEEQRAANGARASPADRKAQKAAEDQAWLQRRRAREEARKAREAHP